MTRADALRLFGGFWIVQSIFMGLSAVGGLLGGMAALVAALSEGQGVPSEVWLYVAPAALQLGVCVFAFAGALSLLRGRSAGVRIVRKASIWLLISVTVTCLLIPGALVVSPSSEVMGWLLAAVVVAGGLSLTLLPAATLKWLQDETA